MAGFFVEQAGTLKLFQQSDSPNSGFRPGQLGAMHATLAHFSVQDDPAIICLPTGYGKTSLMMSLPLLLGTGRVLIVEPSSALRKQVHSHFSALSTLRRIGAIPEDGPLPSVHLHSGRPLTPENWELLRDYDVVVSTPGSSSPMVAPGAASDLFDLVIFDEAHHAPADSWAAYLEHYANAQFIFLTATPFRRDNRVIPGKLVYRYPVMRAVSEGAFDPITFQQAVIENELDDDHVDRVIAQTAVAQLEEDLANGFDHRLFVRAATISSAQALVPVYEQLGVPVAAISSRLTKRQQDAIEEKLVSGELKAIICVDMFGEGYDFPKLKVAALHAPHKSLVPTIQFIGRFARIDNTTGRPTLIAPAFRVREATATLLKEGVDLAQMIDEAALAQIQGAVEAQEFIESLPVRRITESDYESVSALSFNLYAHVRVFHCSRQPDFGLLGERVGRLLRIVKQWETPDGTISLVLTVDEAPPNWATSNTLTDVRHEAFLLMYFPESNYCYIGSTLRTEKLYLTIMEIVCRAASRGLSYEETSRARAGLEGMKFFAVGLQNTTFNSQVETYRTLTGPQAERAVTAGDSRAYAQGHYFGSGMNGLIRETIGASSSSRIWSNQRLSVPDFVAWVQTLNGRIAGDAQFSASHLDLVRTTTTLRELPDALIAANWPRQGLKGNPRIQFRPSPEQRSLLSRLVEWDIQDFDCNPQAGQLDFSIVHTEGQIRMRFSLEGGQLINCLDPEASILVESSYDAWMPLAEWLSEHPPIFYASDKSSFEGMNKIAAPLLRTLALAPGDAESIDWTGCAIEVEFLPNNQEPRTLERRAQLEGNATVQEHLEQYLLTLPDLQCLYYDHRSGEAADYICVTADEAQDVNVTLYHCKGAGGPANGGRVGDVYEVAGQLVKSAYYCEVSTLVHHMEDRMHRRHTSPSYFVRGDKEETFQLLESTPATKLTFTVVGVQPGIRRTMVDERLSDLMAFCIGYARQGAAKAYWLVSE
ncbi:DEAD/DEAH box helicase family protein [Pseudomonas rhodesiae]|uniref:DEAD/DEAH box helicase n=1 Tax=Pseudomonas rhodesiae TaxID=76760 RepID=UPI0021601FE7|nr:DEAD/DEAH box helicase family protein [Pseudomonas rhodesiae]UVL11446.1 DEAD/DEAH box helicase family protein [Pseudomonas rhodesiae]